jgi:glycosyltransferase involved in cell wall biosynthesis
VASSKDSAFGGRVFIGPVEIAGIAEGLAHGLCKLGVDATVVLGGSHRFKYGRKNTFWLIAFWQKLGVARQSVSRAKLLSKIFIVFVHSLWGWLVLLYSLKRYDAFIFLYGQTITNSPLELWLLKKAKRKIIFAGVGSDTRPPYIDGGLFPGGVDDELPDPSYLVGQTKRCKKKLKLQESYANYWVNSPAAAHFHERPFISWPALGIPRNFSGTSPGNRVNSGPVRVLHSPSSPLTKGTPIILAAIERLKARGHEIDFVLIQDLPNDLVLQELQRCDFVVDQLYSDAPMAGFATEAAYFGKPAVVAGYFASYVSQCLKAEDVPPSLFVLPEALESAIERLVINAAERFELGQKAKLFVQSRWNVEEVASRFACLLNDNVPDEWCLDPKDFCYLEGCGLHRERSRKLVKSVIDYAGVAALQLEDKPNFERAFREFALGE